MKPRNLNPAQHRLVLMVMDIVRNAPVHTFTRAEMTGPRRTGPLAFARQVAMSIACHITKLHARAHREDAPSQRAVGEVFHRHHSDVSHACRRVAEACSVDAKARAWVDHSTLGAEAQLSQIINPTTKGLH